MPRAKKQRLAILTVEEDKVWSKAFEWHLNNGAQNDNHAGIMAWSDTLQIFPRLKDFTGCLPDTHVTDKTPAGDIMDFCPMCGESLEEVPDDRRSVPYQKYLRGEAEKRCVNGGVVFRQTSLGTLEVIYSEGKMLGRVHNYIGTPEEDS